MYGVYGIKASELIKQLQEMIDKHGDCVCISGGTDYPEGVSGVRYITKDKADGYIPANTFRIG